MADVRARGQLILITGLTIGALLLALILLMNTVIYTENLATRGAAVGGQEAIEYRSDIVGTATTAMDKENNKTDETNSNRLDRIKDDIAVSEALFRDRYIERATVTRTNFVTSTPGVRIYQDADGQFNDGQLVLGSDDWTIATNVQNIRQYSMTVDRSSLASANESNLNGAFNVSVTDPSSQWTAYVYSNDQDDIAIAVANDTTSGTEICTVSTSEATINFTDGTLNGNVCPGLNWAENVNPQYRIEYRNGDNASGTYDMKVNGDAGEYTNNHSIIYSVTVDLYYESPNLHYEAQVRVAPGEPT